MIEETTVIRSCKKCGKRYALELGYYKAKNGYRSVCKKCTINQVTTHINNKRTGYDYHKFIEDDHGFIVCERCGLIKRKKAARKPGVWISEYKVDGKWQHERPLCKSTVEH